MKQVQHNIQQKLNESIGTVTEVKTVITIGDDGNTEIERVVVAELDIG